MKFSLAAAVVALASTVVAAPNRLEVRQDHSLKDSQNICGKAQIKCCNKQTTKVDNENSGISRDDGVLNNLLDIGNIQDIGIFDQCSKLDLPVPVLGVNVMDLLNTKCKQQAACCQDTNGDANGAVAVNLPCLPVNLL